ncbi:MAG: glycosyltransferase family 2 protein [Anaerolineae bacterium]|nr:glycosyltransferase family 2 protein [Anaerolineae bacterium]
MARIGVNPGRGRSSDYRPAKVTVALLCHIPNLDGYFKHRLDVLKLSLASLHAHTPEPHDLLVFDNGSCPPVVDYLREMHLGGVVDYLVLSQRNIGKIGAFKLLFQTAAGEIVAYCDGDIFFYPGWLPAHLAVLEAFPQVGMVSGIPLRDRSARASRSLREIESKGASGVTITRERLVPDEWEADWAVSVGRDPKEHLASTADHKEVVLRAGGIKAVGTASHFQFVSPRRIVLEALPDNWSGRLMGEMIELDEAVDDAGYLRLSTTQRFVRHMGNALSPDMVNTAEEFGLRVGAPVDSPSYRRYWLMRVPGVRRLVRFLYNLAFDLLHRGGER